MPTCKTRIHEYRQDMSKQIRIGIAVWCVLRGLSGSLRASEIPTDPVAVVIYFDQREYLYHDAIGIHILVSNRSSKDILIPREPSLSEYHWMLAGTLDPQVVAVERPLPAKAEDYVSLRPGQSFDRHVDLSQIPGISLQDGEYIFFVYETYTSIPGLHGNFFRGSLKSNTVRFRYHASQEMMERLESFDLYAGRRIAFVFGKINDSRIYTVDIDGSDFKRLTDQEMDESFPTWSPDGQRLAYIAGREDDQEVYMIDAEGGAPVRLTNIGGHKSGLSWSPDGKQIVFSAKLYSDWEIYKVSLDDLSIVNLTNHPAQDLSPAWSPDGYHIAFFSSRGNRPEEVGYENKGQVYLMSPDGIYVQKLADSHACYVVEEEEVGIVGLSARPWSPDSQQLIYKAGSCRKDCNSCIVNVYDGQIRTLNPYGRRIFSSDWSLDGEQVVYNQQRNDDLYIYSVNHDGTEAKSLHRGWGPLWADEASRIVFISQTGDSLDVYIMNADGREIKRLTAHGPKQTTREGYQLKQLAVNEHENQALVSSDNP